jgi:hypothetical protein
MTTIDATVQAEREQDLLDGFTEMNGARPLPADVGDRRGQGLSSSG